MRKKERAQERKKTVLRWIGEAAVSLAALSAVTFFLPQDVLADLIWTPEDSFYEKNYEDCEYVGRRYYANGEDGYVTIMESPVKARVLDRIPNGSIFYVSMSYDKGRTETWGLVEYLLDENGIPVEDYGWEENVAVGWINMEELQVVYDGISFIEEHASEIEKAEITTPTVKMPENGVIYLWEYPGSEQSYGEIRDLTENMMIDQTYKDQNGDLWAHSNYYFGHRDFWLNLDNPGDANPETIQPKNPNLIPPATRETLEALPKTGRFSTALPLTIAGLIVLTIILTAAAIRYMAGKNKKKAGSPPALQTTTKPW